MLMLKEDLSEETMDATVISHSYRVKQNRLVHIKTLLSDLIQQYLPRLDWTVCSVSGFQWWLWCYYVHYFVTNTTFVLLYGFSGRKGWVRHIRRGDGWARGDTKTLKWPPALRKCLHRHTVLTLHLPQDHSSSPWDKGERDIHIRTSMATKQGRSGGSQHVCTITKSSLLKNNNNNKAIWQMVTMAGEECAGSAWTWPCGSNKGFHLDRRRRIIRRQKISLAHSSCSDYNNAITHLSHIRTNSDKYKNQHSFRDMTFGLFLRQSRRDQPWDRS